MNNRNANALRQLSEIGAWLIYAFAVIYGDVMFLSVVSTAFPKGTLLEALAYGGAIVTAASALILPLALHYWFAPGLQFLFGVLYWFVDAAVLMLNSILAYQVATGHVDSTMQVWQIMAPASPLIAVIGWGLVLLLDPKHRLRHAIAELEADQVDIYASRLREHARSQQTDATLADGAARSAAAYANLLAQGPAVQAVEPPAHVPTYVPTVPTAPVHVPTPDPVHVPTSTRRNGNGANHPNP